MINFTEDQILTMKSGVMIGGSIDPATGGLKATARQPETHVPIEGYGTNVRPQVRNEDGTKVGKAKVTRPSGKQLAAFNKLDEARKKEEIKAAEARQQEIESMLPHNLRAELSYLSRKVKTLEKTVKELKSKQSINHDS